MSTTQIPYYKEINEFLEAIHSRHRTSNPLFFCLRLEDTFPHTKDVVAPFKKGFYFISLITDAGITEITYDTTNVNKLDSFLVFQSPGHIYSWHRDKKAKGYLIYFKTDCFSFFRPDFEKEFPYFDLMNTNFFRLEKNKFNEFSPIFEDVFIAYQENNTPDKLQIACLKFLVLLYKFKEYTSAVLQWQQGFSTVQHQLLLKYSLLVNNYYLEKRTVEEYAELLNISSHHLSQSIKQAGGKNALSYINDRIIKEAKTLIKFTQNDMAEIAYQLNFSDPANFGKFFKKSTGLTPMEFRKNG